MQDLSTQPCVEENGKMRVDLQGAEIEAHLVASPRTRQSFAEWGRILNATKVSPACEIDPEIAGHECT